MSDFAKNLRYYRKQKRLSQAELDVYKRQVQSRYHAVSLPARSGTTRASAVPFMVFVVPLINSLFVMESAVPSSAGGTTRRFGTSLSGRPLLLKNPIIAARAAA